MVKQGYDAMAKPNSSTPPAVAPPTSAAVAAAVEGEAGLVDDATLEAELDALTGNPADEAATTPPDGEPTPATPETAETPAGKPAEEVESGEPEAPEAVETDIDLDDEGPAGPLNVDEATQAIIDKAVGKRVAEKKKLQAENEELKAKLAALEGETQKPVAIDDPDLTGLTSQEDVDRLSGELQNHIAWAMDNLDGTFGPDGEEYTAEQMRAALRTWQHKQQQVNVARANLVTREQHSAKAREAYPLMFEEGNKWQAERQTILQQHPELARLPEADMLVGDLLQGRAARAQRAKAAAAAAATPSTPAPVTTETPAAAPAAPATPAPAAPSGQGIPETATSFDDVAASLDALTTIGT